MRLLWTILLLISSISLHSQDLSKMWFIDKTENTCIKGNTPYPLFPISLLLTKQCKKKKLDKYDDLYPNLIFFEVSCDSKQTYGTLNESDCNELLKYLDIAGKDWYFFSKGKLTYSCYSTVDDPDYKPFKPISLLKRKGCRLDQYRSDLGILILDCKKDTVLAQNNLSSLAFMDSKEKCIESGEQLKNQ